MIWPYIVGTSEDKDGDITRFIENDPALSRQKNRIVNFAGTGKDFETYYRFLMEKGVCLITIDSGPLHIARKLGLPTVSIWGPTDPDNYLKVRPHEQGRHLSYYLGAPCSPCIHRYEKLPCGGDNICMKRIQAKAIIEKIQALLYHLAPPCPA